MSAFPDRVAILVVTIDSIVVDVLPTSPLSTEDDICGQLIAYSRSLGHTYQQVEVVDDSPRTYQLDFTNKEGTACTALAAVFTGTRN